MAERYCAMLRFLGYSVGTYAAIETGESTFVLAYTLLLTEASIGLGRLCGRRGAEEGAPNGQE